VLEMANSPLRAGVTRTDITPPVGIAHAGWGAQTHQRSEGADMPLYITALALERDGLRVAIVDVDILILSAEMDAAARKAVVAATGIPPQNVRIAYSHTHSGPAFISRWITEGADLAKAWLDALPEKVAATVAAAMMDMQSVHVASGVGECFINVNRRPVDAHGSRFTGRNWKDPVDHEVGVVALDTLDGNPLATLMVYACHPTIMGHENRLVTPDFPGPARRVVEQTVGGLCLFLQGAGGNQGPVHGFTGDLRVYRREGTKLGLEAARVRMSLDPFKRRERLVEILPSGADLGIYEDEPVSEPDDSLAVWWSEVDLPLRELEPPETLRARFEGFAAEVERLRASGESGKDLRMAVSRAQKANIALNCALLAARHGKNGHITVSVQAIRIGGAVLAAVPLEPFAEIGLEVKAKSPAARTFFSGFSNGHFNYLPTDIGIEEGGYEVAVSPFAAGSAGLVTQASLEAIERVWSL
jgi:hypothetical protein